MTSTAGQSKASGVDSDNQSLYPPPGWVWQYPKAKKDTTNASPGMLFIVEVVHYLVYFTQVGVAWCFFHYRDFYEPKCGLFFLVIMAPIFQQIAGSFPMKYSRIHWQFFIWFCLYRDQNVRSRHLSSAR